MDRSRVYTLKPLISSFVGSPPTSCLRYEDVGDFCDFFPKLFFKQIIELLQDIGSAGTCRTGVSSSQRKVIAEICFFLVYHSICLRFTALVVRFRVVVETVSTDAKIATTFVAAVSPSDLVSSRAGQDGQRCATGVTMINVLSH